VQARRGWQVLSGGGGSWAFRRNAGWMRCGIIFYDLSHCIVASAKPANSLISAVASATVWSVALPQQWPQVIIMAWPRAAALLCALTWAPTFVCTSGPGPVMSKRTTATIIHAHKQLFHDLRCSSNDGPAFSATATSQSANDSQPWIRCPKANARSSLLPPKRFLLQLAIMHLRDSGMGVSMGTIRNCSNCPFLILSLLKVLRAS
jgi:hypothetical protein